jgi:hypothetical protein
MSVDPAFTALSATMSNDPAGTACTKREEWQRIANAVHRKTLETQTLATMIKKYEGTILSETNTREEAKEAGDDSGVEGAQWAIENTKQRMSQLTVKRDSLLSFEPLAELLTKVQGDLAFKPLTLQGLPEDTLAIKELLQDKHLGILQPVMEFGGKTLEDGNVNMGKLNAVQTAVAKKAGTYAEILEQAAAFWRKMNNQLDPGAGTKKTREGGDEGGESKKKKHKATLPEEPCTGGEEDGEEGVDEGGQKGSTTKPIDTDKFLKYLVRKPVPQELQDYFELQGEPEDPWKVRVLKINYHLVLNEVLGLGDKNARGWQRILRENFDRNGAKWNAVNTEFWLRPVSELSAGVRCEDTAS